MAMIDIQTSLYKYKRLLAFLVVVALLMCNLGLRVIQSYSAEICIKYMATDAENGFTENGSALNPYEIKDSIVVKNALEAAGITGVSSGEVVKGLKITPIIPTAEEEKYAAWIDNFDDYDEDESEKSTPVYYSVRFTTDKGPEMAKKVLNAVLTQYRHFYSENYAAKSDINKLSDDAVLSFDYFETADILGDKVKSDLNYLDSILNGDFDYRSAKTGYSISDLMDEYKTFREAYLASTTQNILENGISRNSDILVTTLTNNSENAQLESDRNEAYASTQEELMKTYSKKNREYMWETYTRNEEGDQVREDTERDRSHNMEKGVYDLLVLDYVDFRVESINLLIDKEYDLKHAQYFASGASDDVETEAKLKELCEKFNELHEVTSETIDDYNNYKEGRSIAFVSGIVAYKTTGEMIYYATSAILAFGIGAVIVILREMSGKKRT